LGTVTATMFRCHRCFAQKAVIFAKTQAGVT
jgi:hypothetical protein